MKICHYTHTKSFDRRPRLAVIHENSTLVDLNFCWALDYERENHYNPRFKADYKLPPSLYQFLQVADEPIEQIEEAYGLYLFFCLLGEKHLRDGTPVFHDLSDPDIRLTCPMDKVGTFRDFYTHEKHVKKGFEKRGEKIPEAWYEMPVYYKGANTNFIGPGEEILWPNYSQQLDYELELAAVIGRSGKNIKAEDALDHVFGYTLLNDISARDIQKKEMSVRLGPSKGKDFCSVLGPVIITADEFEDNEPNLLMQAHINGELWSEGRSSEGRYSFAQMIEFASKEEWLTCGDVLGSGTIGSGCGLELDRWIRPGDEVKLSAEMIGELINRVGPKGGR